MGRPASAQSLPAAVRAWAARCGARRGPGQVTVSLRQSGEMRNDAGAPWRRFQARQAIAVDRPGFRWTARTWPLGAVSVVDALEDDRALLRVRLLGAIPVMTAAPSPALLKGELMRYLAELPWAPDAALRNPHLSWRAEGTSAFWVAAAAGGVEARVCLQLDGHGLVASVFAPDRPRLESDRAVERPWLGHFSDYVPIDGRLLPRTAEVGWLLDGRKVSVWRGRLEHWRLAP